MRPFSRRHLIAVLFLFFAALMSWSHGYPDGAPIQTCQDMAPHHRVSPQTSDSPFSTTSVRDKVNQGGTLQLTLATTNPTDTFRGYILEAFDSSDIDGPMIGTFSNPSNGKLLDCPNPDGGPASSVKNAVTHKSAEEKRSVTVEWTPPADFTGTVVFKSTFVKKYSTFWLKTESAPVQVVDNL